MNRIWKLNGGGGGGRGGRRRRRRREDKTRTAGKEWKWFFLFAAYLRGRDSSGWPVLQPPPSPPPTRFYTVDGSIIPKIRGTARRYTDNEDPPTRGAAASRNFTTPPPPATPSFKSGSASNPLGNAASFYYEIILPELFSKYKPRDGPRAVEKNRA